MDDDALLRESVVAILEELCGQVYEASDGVEGLEVLGRHPDISVVITDIAMPRLDGIGFARQARRDHPDLKVLFLSGLYSDHPPARSSAKAVPAARAGLGPPAPAGNLRVDGYPASGDAAWAGLDGALDRREQ